MSANRRRKRADDATQTSASISRFDEAEQIVKATNERSLSDQATLEDLIDAGLLEVVKEDGETVGWLSNEGLFYGVGSRHGNRLYHVFAHLTEDSSKPTHTVFDTDRAGLVLMLDEAWQLRETADSDLQDNGNRIYDVEMNRVIGTRGENEIRLVLIDGSNHLITAYPRE